MTNEVEYLRRNFMLEGNYIQPDGSKAWSPMGTHSTRESAERSIAALTEYRRRFGHPDLEMRIQRIG